jgi:hypothetical protein
VAALVVAALAGPVPHAVAAPAWLDFHLKEKSRPAFPVAHYAVDTGGGFVLDLGGARPMLRFDDSPEIWLLRSARGPRGDEILADDLGGPRLRITRLGGVTVFTPRHPEGSAAALEGSAVPFRLARLDAGALYQRLVAASLRASRAAQRLIAFQALDVDADSAGLIADAALVATESVVQLAASPGGRQRLSQVGRFDFTRGRSADVRFEGGVIHIAVASDRGAPERPSSARILQAIVQGDRRPPGR